MKVFAYIDMHMVSIVWQALTLLSIGASNCRDLETLREVEGFCPGDEDTIVLEGINTCRHQCLQSGLHRQCKVITYNTAEDICLIPAHLCPVMQPNSIFTLELPVRDPDIQCIHWIPFNAADEVPDRTVQDVSDRVVIVAARFSLGHALLPAKYEISRKEFYSTMDGVFLRKVPGPQTQLLVVDRFCTTKWVPYSAERNDPIPAGAIEAGYKPGSPFLYFIRMWVNNPPVFLEYAYGYYDPGTRRGYGHAGGVLVEAEFEFLCII